MEPTQITIPPSFIDLFVAPGRSRPVESQAQLASRHELCEDMAQMLTETARVRLYELGIAESDVLDRIHRGLRAEPSPLSAPEATWVVCRLAELLAWPLPPDVAALIPPATLARHSRA